MSATPTVSAKGKLTLSEGVLKHLGVEPGDKVVIAKLPGGKINISAAPRGSITEAFGFLKRKGSPVLSIEQIKAATIHGWSGQTPRVRRRSAKK